MGLRRSYRHAAKEVTQGATAAGKAAAARNEAALQVFLARAGDGVVDGDAGVVKDFERGGKGLPVPGRELEEWVAGREREAVAAFKAGAARFEVGIVGEVWHLIDRWIYPKLAPIADSSFLPPLLLVQPLKLRTARGRGLHERASVHHGARQGRERCVAPAEPRGHGGVI